MENNEFKRTVKDVEVTEDPESYKKVGKLNMTTINRIANAISSGHPVKSACGFGMITPSTFTKWFMKGQKEFEYWGENGGIEKAELDGGYTLSCEFFIKINQAIYKAQELGINVLKRAIEGGDWKAGAFYLERRFKKEWGKEYYPDGDNPLEDKTKLLIVPTRVKSIEEWNANQKVVEIKEDDNE